MEDWCVRHSHVKQKEPGVLDPLGGKAKNPPVTNSTMVKKIRAKKGNKTSPKKAGVRKVQMSGPMSDPRVRAWDQLLRDPCAAPLAPPCYAGVDSGYLVRTVDFFQPTYTGTGFTVGPSTVDAIVQFTPYNYSGSTGVVASTAPAGGSLTPLVASGFATNFINSATVARYRAVAMCVKWIPTGTYANRAGLVASGYTPGMVVSTGAFSGNIGTITAEVQRQAPNGTEIHEVRWLPTAVDENFTSITAAANSGAGSVLFALRGVDGVNSSTTTGNASGFFQITTAWEWLPTGTTGLSVSPTPPLPYTSQQVLGTIRDMGAYLFHGIREAAGLMRDARAGVQLLTGGVGMIQRRGASIPLIRY